MHLYEDEDEDEDHRDRDRLINLEIRVDALMSVS